MSEAYEFDDHDPGAHVPSVIEVQAWPDSAAAWAVQVPPGSATASVLAVLEPGRLSQAGRVDALVGLDRLAAWVHAEQTRVLAAMADDEFAGAVAPKLEREWVSEDVRAALGESARGARARLRSATELVHRLPATLDALSSGRITARHASAVIDSVAVLADGPAHEVEQAVLPHPERASEPMPDMASFRRRLRRAGIKADPRSAAEKAARAAEDRDVWVMPQDDAMAFLGAPLPGEGAATVLAAVQAKAEEIKTATDPRTKAQRRADALVQLCADYLNGIHTGNCTDTGADLGVKIEMDTVATRAGDRAPRYHGLKPQIQVCVALSTLLGLDEQPGELDGHGPIPADVARRIAADPSGTWRRLVTDELGHLVDYGRSTREPPPDLARYVIARDRTCRFPGCNRPAATSDLHHIRWWSRGGHTNAANLGAVCERNHYGVHDGGWQMTRLPDGTIEWTSPDGHTYRVPPATYPVDHTTKIKMDTDDAPDERGQ